jgi:hypothetical protein
MSASGEGQVKKIKVISDKNGIAGSNFERPRYTGGENIGWKFDTNSSVIGNTRTTAKSRYVITVLGK